jgi:hypothetical protein
MARKYIVGRQMIVGAGARHDEDFKELMRGLSTGAEEGGGGHHHLHPHEHPGFHRGTPVAYQRDDRARVVEEHPTHEREFPIGFNSSTNVPSSQTVQIEVKPQVLFRGERLAVPNSIVLNFDVADIKVGKDSQLAAPGNMPSECFSNVSVGVRMQLDTAEPGITITLFMNNTDANNAHPFKSVLYGTVIE